FATVRKRVAERRDVLFALGAVETDADSSLGIAALQAERVGNALLSLFGRTGAARTDQDPLLFERMHHHFAAHVRKRKVKNAARAALYIGGYPHLFPEICTQKCVNGALVSRAYFRFLSAKSFAFF